jgi:hypothetical protein
MGKLQAYAFQLVQHLGKVFRQGGKGQDRSLIPGVLKAQLPGVKALGRLPQLRFFVSVDPVT